MSRFEKTTHFAQFIDFKLKALYERRVVGQFVAVGCALIAAPAPDTFA